MIARLAQTIARLPEELKSRMRTVAYRRLFDVDVSARIVGNGLILCPRRDRTLVKIGKHTALRGELFVFPHGGRISIGDWCFVGDNSRIWSAGSVEIGDRVLISHDVNIHDTNGHPLDAVERHEQTRAILTVAHPDRVNLMTAPVKIEDDAWIGFGAAILKGVTIGEGAVVAARSLVVKDVAPWTLVAGNPARPIRDLKPHD